MKIEKVSISTLIQDPANARKHNKRNIDAIKGSLTRFGQQKPIVVNEKNIVIAGNGTLVAAMELGWQEINIVRTELDGIDQTAFAIADNRTGELAEWDLDNLGSILKQLDPDLLGDIGFDDKDLSKLIIEPIKEGLCNEDEIPEVTDTRCKPGDLWQLGNHRLLCGDSTNVQHVERLMGGEKADMVFTDPPYGMKLDTNYDAMFGASDSTHKKTGHRFKSVKGDDVDYDPSPILYFQCQLFVWGCDYFYKALPSGGSFVAWDKRNENLDKVPGNPTEFCWAYPPVRRCSARILWSGHHGMQSDDTKSRVHPTQKPAKLAEWFFEQWGTKAKNIVDIYLGSGSTLIACEKTNRRCFGLEIDPGYCDIILARWEKFTGQQAKLLQS